MFLIPGDGGDNLPPGLLLEFMPEPDGMRGGFGFDQPMMNAVKETADKNLELSESEQAAQNRRDKTMGETLHVRRSAPWWDRWWCWA